MPDSIPFTARSHSTPYALAVLGGGAAGGAAARQAARQGTRVALLVPDEAEAEPGASGDFARAVRRLQAQRGLRPPPLPIDEPRIDVFPGPVWFSRYRTVSVGGVEVRFGRAVVATGAEAGAVAVAGAEEAEPLRPHELDRLDGPPQRLAVLGSDGEACFWAQQMRRLGSEVYLIAAGPRLLEASDEQAAQIVARRLEAEGVCVRTGCEDVALDRTGNRRGVLIGRGERREKLLADEVLVCPEPRPRVAGLALATAAVAYSERGIGVDDRLRTSERHVFAAGGACGPHFTSPEAEEATGRLAARNALAWVPRRLGRCVVPRCTPTDPPIVELGLRPAEAAAAGIDVEPRRFEFRATEAADPDEVQGYLALLVGPRGRVVGATIAATGSEELALPLMLLMSRGLPLRILGAITPCRSGRARLLAALAEK